MSQRPRRNPVPRLCAALLALGLALLPARAAFTRAPEYTTYTYLPTITTTGRTYVPLVQRSGAPPNPAGTPINIIANPSFENQAWFTDGFGNQHPAGWQFYAPAQGQTMPFSTNASANDTMSSQSQPTARRACSIFGGSVATTTTSSPTAATPSAHPTNTANANSSHPNPNHPIRNA